MKQSTEKVKITQKEFDDIYEIEKEIIIEKQQTQEEHEQEYDIDSGITDEPKEKEE